METLGRLNLGCGGNPLVGYLNVDKFGNPDLVHDLESFPWPWVDNSFHDVVMSHVLEHLGETTEVFLGIMKELYRVCKSDATVRISVPHPRHDDFINDPTHKRVITQETFNLFSKKLNFKWKNEGYANTTLGQYLNIDFEVVSAVLVPDDIWKSKIHNNEITQDEFMNAIKQFNNVIKEIRIVLKVIK